MSRNLRPFVLVAMLVAIPLAMWPAVATAQERHHWGRPAIVIGGYYHSPFLDPFFHDPFWGSYAWGPDGSSYYSNGAEVRVLATPRDAEVFVDGYYAGPVSKFSGVFQHLNVQPGGHEFVLYRDGYQTVHQTVYLQPGSSLKLQHTMEPLATGQRMESRPVPGSAASYSAPMAHPTERTRGMEPVPLVPPGSPRSSE
jgi:hypothetical protein